MLPITAIILTYNEEENISACLKCLTGKVKQILVLDSYSTDKTLEIISSFKDVQLFQHTFENYGRQRNWAFENLPIQEEFIFNIDADHRPGIELFEELKEVFATDYIHRINGFMASRKTLFLGRWIKHGGQFPIYHAIIFRKGFGYCEDKEYDQHFVIEGKTHILKATVDDTITNNLTEFVTSHNRWATLEAKDAFLIKNSENKVKALRNGNAMERHRYKRLKYYDSPIFLRVFLYYFYRMVVRAGWRDGKEGLIFHTLQGFWFRFLVDAKIWELKNRK